MVSTVRHFYLRENPISSQGIEFAAEAVEEASVIYKFGFTDVVGTDEDTIWPHNSIYVFPTTAVSMNVSSTSNTDQTGGGGATTVVINGLDADYNDVSETVNTVGVAGISTVNQFLRINRVSIMTAEANATNAGDIYVGTGNITSGVPDIFYANVQAGEGQTLQAIYTVPAGKDAFITSIAASHGRGVNDATVRFKQRNENGVFKVLDKFVLLQNSINIKHSSAVKIEEKTDLVATAAASAGAVDVSFAWNMILFNNT